MTKTTTEYRVWYERGWRYSSRGAGSLDYGDAHGFPDAWYDGYLDYAAGRDKWHYETCDGECGAH